MLECFRFTKENCKKRVVTRPGKRGGGGMGGKEEVREVRGKEGGEGEGQTDKNTTTKTGMLRCTTTATQAAHH